MTWFPVPSKTSQARLTLFCIPHAGVGASAYRGWPEALRPDIEALPIQLPGRENRYSEPPYSAMNDLVRAVADAVVPFTGGPFAFFGNSMGGLVALETIREIKRRTGRVPVHFFVSACAAPQAPRLHSPMHSLPDPEFVAELRQRYDGIPRVILDDPEFLQALLPTMRADLQLYEQYVYNGEEPLECPISAFGGRQDAIVPVDSLGAWREHTADRFEVQLFDAGHFYLQTERATLTRHIRAVYKSLELKETAPVHRA